MEPVLLDHLLLVTLVALLPISAALGYRRLLAKLEAGAVHARVSAYQKTFTVQWGLSGVVLLTWLLSGRSAHQLGLGLELGTGLWVGALLTVAACAVLFYQLVAVSRDPSRLESLGRRYESVRPIIPQSAREVRWFNALSVTAGICEELLYRGFLIAYLSSYVGTLWAVLLSSLAFGLGHSYQGLRGVVRTAGVGLVLAGLYVLTGSLWAPILLHAIVDITSGTIARRAFASGEIR